MNPVAPPIIELIKVRPCNGPLLRSCEVVSGCSVNVVDGGDRSVSSGGGISVSSSLASTSSERDSPQSGQKAAAGATSVPQLGQYGIDVIPSWYLYINDSHFAVPKRMESCVKMTASVSCSDETVSDVRRDRNPWCFSLIGFEHEVDPQDERSDCDDEPEQRE